MNVLIVESNPELGGAWKRHLQRQDVVVTRALRQDEAVAALNDTHTDVIVLNLEPDIGSALALADYAAFRRPHAKVIFVISSNYFSDGSIFSHYPNACACLPILTSPQDLAATVEYHGRAAV